MPAFYGERNIPGYIKTEDEAIEYAKAYARDKKLMLWLVMSRKENKHIDRDGTIKSRNEETSNCSWLPGKKLNKDLSIIINNISRNFQIFAEIYFCIMY